MFFLNPQFDKTKTNKSNLKKLPKRISMVAHACNPGTFLISYSINKYNYCVIKKIKILKMWVSMERISARLRLEYSLNIS